MTAWTNEEFDTIVAADELELASAKPDGSLRNPVTIWVVGNGDDLFVRSVYGRTSAWFRGVQDRHEGHIHAGSVDKDVAFVEVDKLEDEIDDAYRTKYRRYDARYVDPIVSPEAQAATLKLVPR